MTSLPNPELSRAVLIGTSDFQHGDLPSLPAVRNNLTELSRVLTDPVSGVLSWQNTTIIDSPESPNTFIRRLTKEANRAEDLLLVYYAGHGVRHQTRDELYLTVHQTDTENLSSTAVPFEWVREAIGDSPARTRLLILDCCYSGIALGAMASSAVDSREIEVSGTSVLTSAPKNKISHSPPGERYTAFTAELIALLSNGPRFADQELTVQQIYRSLRAAMVNRNLPEPKFKALDTSSDLVLRRTEDRPKAPPVPVKRQGVPPVEEPPRPSSVKITPPAPMPMPEPQPEHLNRVGTPVQEDAVNERPRLRPGAALGRLLLFPGLMLGADMILSGFVGAMFGVPPPGRTTSQDAQIAVIGLFLTGLCGLLLGLRKARKRREGTRPPALADVAPKLAATLARIRTTVLVILLFVSAVTLVTGLFGDTKPVPGSTYSDLNSQVATGLIMAEIAVACGYALFKHYRH
jgi:hypothetical protein